MIRYALSCAQDHSFESWFQNADAFDALLRAGQLSCPICGDAKVSKGLMAPAVSPSRRAEAAKARAEAPSEAAPLAAQSELEKALAEMRRHIETNSEYVGGNFVSEARAMHEGETPGRSIYGEAKPEEARKLLDDGIAVTPLPFLPRRKTN
ncbi:DUF1178 family protein [Xinfangfangia sp. CPCC 101601]|uniref:DUF1178 family protein n=1 Tax=Pseudogemmobacter lacusdianii TaxID=3069608 RepID=A0ABU0VVR5_9RHOB|nr:DUF1178 family protein [Xinfangfangia sp. CPCC 101601]MDQ2065778.1 DUF1178 family protein [Xinfangfangia sp. CPCC 101601]